MNSPALSSPPKREPILKGFWRLGVLEWFLIIQLLASGLVLLPGAGHVRLLFRALPYLASLAMLLWSFRGSPQTRQRPAGHYWLLASLVILGIVIFFHPSTLIGVGGIQFIYQLSIAAPLFWVKNYRVDYQRSQSLIWILFLCSGLSSVVGALQVYFPDTFMPKDVDRGMSLDYVASMMYEGANGKMIMRPPGLTDLPGGAAGAAVLTATLGLMLLTGSSTKKWQRILCVVLTMVGFFVLYLTQIRSAVLELISVIIFITAFRIYKQRIAAGFLLFGASALVVALAFAWATSVGGAQVSDRFFGLINQGVTQSYRVNRGAFVADTFQDIVPKYPFGGAAGQWGIIGIYFNRDMSADRPYAEIQITGWVLDGGIPLLVCYSMAILVAMLGLLKITWRAVRGIEEVGEAVLCVNLIMVLGAFAGPTFNTQGGTLFWFLTAMVYQLMAGTRHSRVPAHRISKIPPKRWRTEPALRGARLHRGTHFEVLPSAFSSPA